MTVDFEWQAAQARIGMVQSARPGDFELVEKTLDDLRALNIKHWRSGICWADWHNADWRKWLDWFIPRVAQEAELLPCISCASRFPTTEEIGQSVPQTAAEYTGFVDALITNYGDHFEWIELWNEANQPNGGNWRPDPEWLVLSETLSMATQRAKMYGKKTALAGASPSDLNWLELMCARGSLAHVDAVGIHGDFTFHELAGNRVEHDYWPEKIAQIRDLLDEYSVSPELWLTEVGCSTWQQDEMTQIKTLIDALEAPVDRVYWYSMYDSLPRNSPTQNSSDARDKLRTYFGIKAQDGEPKLLFRVWQECGIGGLNALVENIYRDTATGSVDPMITDSYTFQRSK